MTDSEIEARIERLEDLIRQVNEDDARTHGTASLREPSKACLRLVKEIETLVLGASKEE